MKTMYELELSGGRYGLVSLCIGGGQGIASIFERPQLASTAPPEQDRPRASGACRFSSSAPLRHSRLVDVDSPHFAVAGISPAALLEDPQVCSGFRAEYDLTVPEELNLHPGSSA